ncbi:autophagy-related protein-like protein 22 [Plenodomus tracheiphilus IPT5]|uniref:Autophagy-related protein n=1 Tax=Plenodomus tracheiphilus IPT5 TaxID=1408161 RepID=A0A6A7B809_9PLEO|nr:autophagy-related protein-like protein 22 [Plenodomus tracheiphilus IPT5]
MSFQVEAESNVPTSRKLFKDEDTTLTTPRELKGWYAYPIAAEVYAVVAVGAFLPVILEQLARENGVFYSDRSKSCIDHGDATGRVRMREEGTRGGDQCMIRVMGKEMSTSSFAMYTFSTAVLIQAFVLVCFSSFADYGPYRKKMLLTFAYVGSIASCSFIFITPSVFYLAPVLVIVGVTSLGCSFVLLNAFLPLLVARDPDALNGDYGLADDDSDFELDALNPGDIPVRRHPHPETRSSDLVRSAQISSKGVGYGYIAAVLVEVFSILVLYLFSKTAVQKRHPSLPIRVILFIAGIWWAVFTIPTFLWLRPRPGPPLPSQHKSRPSSRLRTFLFYTAFSLRSFWRTLKRAMKLRQTLIFLVSWFLLSDAVATISGTAVLFARTELHMGSIAIALLSITSIGSGIIGAFAWPRVQQYFSLQPKTILLCCVAGMEVIPLYGLLGYIPLFQKLGFIGLQKAWEIYPIAVLHGTVMGGISSYARAVYAPLIPQGSEAAFFALYAVTDKGSSAVGPAVVGWIVDQAGTIRPAFIFLTGLVIMPAPLLWILNVEKGREDAAVMAVHDGSVRGAYERVGESD